MYKTASILLFGALLLTGCSQTREPSYADAYRDALPRYQGTSDVTEAMTERFVTFFSHEQAADGDTPDPAELYGEPLYFSDTLLTTENREAALAHLRRMHDSTESLDVTVLDQLIDGQDAYLIWQMTAVFTPVSGAVTSNSIGVTHLRFDADGRIILQQDFWDSAAGLYQHVPVLGSLIGTVQSRFETDEQ
jgi:hypothetical protein